MERTSESSGYGISCVSLTDEEYGNFLQPSFSHANWKTHPPTLKNVVEHYFPHRSYQSAVVRATVSGTQLNVLDQKPAVSDPYTLLLVTHDSPGFADKVHPGAPQMQLLNWNNADEPAAATFSMAPLFVISIVLIDAQKTPAAGHARFHVLYFALQQPIDFYIGYGTHCRLGRKVHVLHQPHKPKGFRPPLPLTSLSALEVYYLWARRKPAITTKDYTEGILDGLREQWDAHTQALKSHKPHSAVQQTFSAANRSGARWSIVSSVVALSIAIRIIAGFQPHSGQFNAPVYGDYEAHRHWKEITFFHPLRSWYASDTHFWDLDYPPLTAYHEWFMGYLSHRLHPASVSPKPETRGYLTPGHKTFMRWSTLLSDLLVFHTGAVVYWLYSAPRIEGVKERDSLSHRVFYLVLFLTCPPFIFIDHVHFQYNAVALGLVLWVLNAVVFGYNTIGVVRKSYRSCGVIMVAETFFHTLYPVVDLLSFSGSRCLRIVAVCAVLYKQTMLYFIPAMGSYFLSTTILSLRAVGSGNWALVSQLSKPENDRESPRRLLLLVHTVGRCVLLVMPCFLTLATVLVPFMVSSYNGPCEDSAHCIDTSAAKLITPIMAIIKRIFPFHRGIYEDYVSNIWVTLAPVLKLNRYARQSPLHRTQAVRGCLLVTVGAFGSSFFSIFRYPSIHNLQLSLFITSMAFYLFSPQVHEKAILLPLLAALLLLSCYYDAFDEWLFIHQALAIAPVISNVGFNNKNSVNRTSLAVVVFSDWISITFAITASFSLFHLMEKDVALVPFIGFLLIWVSLALWCAPQGFRPHGVSPSSTETASSFSLKAHHISRREPYTNHAADSLNSTGKKKRTWFANTLAPFTTDLVSFRVPAAPIAVFTGAIFLLIFQALYSPPARYPYLHTYFQAVYCCTLFFIFFVAATTMQNVLAYSSGTGEVEDPPFAFPGLRIEPRSQLQTEK